MNRFVELLSLSLLFLVFSSCNQEQSIDPEVAPLYEMCDRLFSESKSSFHFSLSPEYESQSKRSYYRVETERGTVRISGSDKIALAVGLNRYLRELCHVNVSPHSYEDVALPTRLPDAQEPLEGEATVPERFFLNYCTFGYSMPFWKWSDWERLIDWMALNGVTMPLAITGQERVWLNVWTELGLDPEDVKAYFTGPAHLPWHRMNNIDRWEGPLPDDWIDGQVTLQKKILERERSFGMRPVLPAFAGHVPQELQDHFPDAQLLKLGEWGGFDEKYGTYYLSPTSPLFSEIQRLFLEKQTELYGTDHIYGIDAFNEVDAPEWSPEFLAGVASAIYNSLTDVDEDAKWLMMTWLFYYDKENWTPERVRAFLEAVPQGNLYLLDYYCDKAEVWRKTQSFYGQPYLWCYLGNFGGNSWLCGNLRDVQTKFSDAQVSSANPPMGIGCTLEGFDVNPLMYEFVLSQAWAPAPTAENWLLTWANMRGNLESNGAIYRAWQILDRSAYQDFSQGSQSVLIHSRPSLYGYEGWNTVPDYLYDNNELVEAWKLLVKSYPTVSTHQSELEFDIVNVGRQVLGNHFMVVRDAFAKAYESSDRDQVESIGVRMNELISDYATLLAYAPYFTMSKWIKDARDLGAGDDELADYYEHNARSIITVWGQSGKQLTDYASRAWSGLVRSYYGPRWDYFITSVLTSMDQKSDFDQEQFRKEMIIFEEAWRNSSAPIDETGSPDPLDQFALSLIEKYFD
ncbi:MAG: alpha-N-acetylglucosaminidase [Porphyromonas sp.]|nr:alpha-N-acetylglucosaminidase [Porphyromonas sp.]